MPQIALLKKDKLSYSLFFVQASKFFISLFSFVNYIDRGTARLYKFSFIKSPQPHQMIYEESLFLTCSKKAKHTLDESNVM